MDREPGCERRQRDEADAEDDGDPGDQPGDSPDLALEWALLGLDPLRERSDPPELGAHPGRVDEGLRVSATAGCPAEDELPGLNEGPIRVDEVGRAHHAGRLARQRGHVDFHGARDQAGVGRDAIALGDHQHIAADKLASLDLVPLPVTDYGGVGRQELLQRLDSALGLLLLDEGEPGVEDDHDDHGDRHRGDARGRCQRRRPPEEQRQWMRELPSQLAWPVDLLSAFQLVRPVGDQAASGLSRG